MLSDKAIPNFMKDLFVAGAQTTATTLGWAYLYMAEYEDVQKKCYEEIESVGAWGIC